MSVINFKCSSERKETVINVCWNILIKHYLETVSPNTKVEFNPEDQDIYQERLDELMFEELCEIEDSEEGVQIKFDSTEYAGFCIADNVYGTGMGYSDNGLTYLKPVFDKLIKLMPDICFDAECECYDKWVSEEYFCSYDGETFSCDAEWDDEEWN